MSDYYGKPWWEPGSNPPGIPAGSTDEQRRMALLLRIYALVERTFMEIDHMAKEWDDHKTNLANAKAAMLTAMTLIDQLDKPAIPPTDVVTEDASLMTVTAALLAKIAAHTPTTPQAPPPVVSTGG